MPFALLKGIFAIVLGALSLWFTLASFGAIFELGRNAFGDAASLFGQAMVYALICVWVLW